MQFLMIRPDEQAQHKSLMDEAFRLRHRCFNEWLGWNLPHSDGKEIDEFDAGALHLFALNKAGDLVGCYRMMPTTRPFFSQTAFPQLFDMMEQEFRPDPATWDLSRFALDYRAFGKDTVRVAGAGLLACVVELAIVHGITAMLSTQNTFITQHANNCFGQPTFETKPIPAGKTDVALYGYEPNLMQLMTMRAYCQIVSPALSNLKLFDLNLSEPSVEAVA